MGKPFAYISVILVSLYTVVCLWETGLALPVVECVNIYREL